MQIDGKRSSDDRRRMLVPGCGFNFELTLVYSAAADVGGKWAAVVQDTAKCE